MKIFLDTAHIQDIKKWAATGIIDGVTTNPSNLAKEGGDPKKRILEICALLPNGQISVEVTEQEAEAVYQQALTIAGLSKNILVKIPCHEKYYGVIKRLVAQGIKVNVTLVFSLFQGVAMAKLGVTYVSPFVGRLDDINMNGAQLVCQLVDAFEKYDFQTGVLAASLRNVGHVHEALQAGAHALTMPQAVLQSAVHHSLTDSGIEKFNQDWQKLGIKQFP